MKAYTDLSQCEKLVSILPIESADMWYHGHCSPLESERVYDEEPCPFHSMRPNWDKPCWSLDALLEAMPQYITKYIESERCQKIFHLNLFRSYYHCCSYCTKSSVSDDEGDDTLYCFGRDNWVDACVAMILKLNELKLL